MPRQSPSHTLDGNIAAQKARLEAKMAMLEPGPKMDALRKKIRELETVRYMNDWLSSPVQDDRSKAPPR